MSIVARQSFEDFEAAKRIGDRLGRVEMSCYWMLVLVTGLGGQEMSGRRAARGKDDDTCR